MLVVPATKISPNIEIIIEGGISQNIFLKAKIRDFISEATTLD